jgi:ABC-type polysaccharide/polyol phosphate export permease
MIFLHRHFLRSPRRLLALGSDILCSSVQKSGVVIAEIYDTARRPPPMLEELVQLFRYRDLALQLVLRNIKARYKRSMLGVLWTMLNPFLMMIILTLVFSGLFGLRIPNYSVYLLAGLLLWNFFAQATITAANEIVWGASLVKRIYVPRTIFAVATVGTGLINLILALVPLLLIMLVLRVPFGPALLSLPLPILLTVMFALGVGLFVSSLAVYFADIVDIYQIALTAWMYLTPIIYPIDIIPLRYRWLFNLNPMYHLVTLFRAPIYQNTLAPLNTVAITALFSVAALVVGWWIFAGGADPSDTGEEACPAMA